MYDSTGLESEEAVRFAPASGKRDEIAKKRIALRELKETRIRLRMLRACNILADEHDPIIAENDELIRIVTTIIRKAEDK